MYGAGSQAAGGAGFLAYTGANAGWLVFAGVTLVFAGVALWQLARRRAKGAPRP